MYIYIYLCIFSIYVDITFKFIYFLKILCEFIIS